MSVHRCVHGRLIRCICMVVQSVVVCLMIMITMSMGMTLISQDHHADSIHDQTDDCYHDCLVVENFNRIDDA